MVHEDYTYEEMASTLTPNSADEEVSQVMNKCKSTIIKECPPRDKSWLYRETGLTEHEDRYSFLLMSSRQEEAMRLLRIRF